MLGCEKTGTKTIRIKRSPRNTGLSYLLTSCPLVGTRQNVSMLEEIFVRIKGYLPMLAGMLGTKKLSIKVFMSPLNNRTVNNLLVKVFNLLP